MARLSEIGLAVVGPKPIFEDIWSTRSDWFWTDVENGRGHQAIFHGDLKFKILNVYIYIYIFSQNPCLIVNRGVAILHPKWITLSKTMASCGVLNVATINLANCFKFSETWLGLISCGR